MWTELTPASLRSRLADAEQRALDTAATSVDVDSALTEVAAMIAAEWRGALARVVALDTRPLAVPPEIMVHILADFRYRAFTRLPGMSRLMDDLRREEWRRANQIRDNLGKIQIADPEDPYAPEAGSGGIPLPAFDTPDHTLDP
jgi:hypothetical protein